MSIKACSPRHQIDVYRIARTFILTVQRYEKASKLPNKSRFIFISSESLSSRAQSSARLCRLACPRLLLPHCHVERSRDISAACRLRQKAHLWDLSTHSVRSRWQGEKNTVEMTYCVVPFRQNQGPFRPFVANHPPCRNKRMRKSVNPLGLAHNPLTFAPRNMIHA